VADELSPPRGHVKTLILRPKSGHNGRSYARTATLCERLEAAINLYDPGLMDENHISEMIDKIRQAKPADEVVYLKNLLPVASAKSLCDCATAHPHNSMGCRMMPLVHDLEERVATDFFDHYTYS
jgi:hypothetical protein